MDINEWFIEAYDDYVRSCGDDGALLEEIRGALIGKYAEAINGHRINRPTPGLEVEGRDLFNKIIGAERERRKGSFRNSMEYLVDALNGNTILGEDDPALAIAYPIGDGSDKVLRLWTFDDWNVAVTGRYRKAAEGTAAAADFDSVSQVILAFMTDRRARVTGDLFAAVIPERI